jgi:hypothetical protein
VGGGSEEKGEGLGGEDGGSGEGGASVRMRSGGGSIDTECGVSETIGRICPEGFRSIVNQKISYGCEQESQDLI